jgi:magnesium transporter
MDLTETHRETASGLLDTYHSSISTRMNEIMKVLTIIATIFIPLSFIAGVYGMNFDPEKSPWNMPELDWYFGYPYALALMAAVAAGLIIYFVRNGWIGRRKR